MTSDASPNRGLGVRFGAAEHVEGVPVLLLASLELGDVDELLLVDDIDWLAVGVRLGRSGLAGALLTFPLQQLAIFVDGVLGRVHLA
eukprot:scaffold19458_cov112-Isochrysis_galbana.AAC.4